MIQLPPFHTAEEMRAISDLAHTVEGTILAVTALLALAEAAGRLRERRGRYLWPATVCAAGVFLLGYLLVPHHGLETARVQWAFVTGDPQQRQHLSIAVLAAAGGAAELLHRAGRLAGWGWALAWPAAVAGIGAAFLLHTQHGTGEAVARAVMVHRALGAAFLATALLRAATVTRLRPGRWLPYAWGVTLLVAAALLLAYREPAGAYAAPAGGHARHDPTAEDSPR